MDWSPQQQAFLDWAKNGKGSCVLVAVAGAGKTTVLLAAAAVMRGTVAIMAYNKDIAVELQARLVKAKSTAKAGTVHSFGFAAVRKSNPGCRVDTNKVRDIFDLWININDRSAVALRTRSGELFKLVSLAKQMALGVDGRLNRRRSRVVRHRRALRRVRQS